LTQHQTVEDWLKAVASKQPTPGGGSVAAHIGANATALFAMVARFSRNHPFGPAFANALDQHTARFLQLGMDDAAGYQQLKRTLKQAKAQAINQADLDAAYIAAATAPMRIFELTALVARQFIAVYPNTNANLASDTQMAALLLETTFASALLNIQINLSFCQSPVLIETMQAQILAHAQTRQTLLTLVPPRPEPA
jgi:formiminotetrahydrofolate cyclodeaminase